MSELIEQYLRAKGVRYYRGHHDGEFFYLADAGGCRRLHVHLRSGPGGEVVVTISPGRYFPAERAERLGELAATSGAVVQPSCDPALVALVVCDRGCPADAAELARLADDALASAADLFRRVDTAAAA